MGQPDDKPAPPPAGSASADLWSGETIAATGSAPGTHAAPAGPELPVIELDRYVAEREVARGGMGRIVAARDRRLARPVALKELLGDHPEQAARFRREALITARLQHPAIVPVYEAGRWPSGEPFFAMKLVAGRPLDKVLAEKRTLDERLALLPAIIAAADAIAYAHSQRVIHRDLKPSNVLVGDFGETVVIDWGLAKDLDAVDDDSRPPETRAKQGSAAPDATISDMPSGLTMAGAVMGTPAYMPPEQARGDVVDERADVFALGAMLYHLLAGAQPYQARTTSEVVEAAMKGAVVPLRERAPRGPRDLATIVARAMAFSARDRYATARELAQDLKAFQTGQLVGAHRYTTRERLVRFVRRHRGAVSIAAGALVVFAVAGSLAIRSIVSARDRAERARAIAETRRAAAEKLVDYVVRDLHDKLGPIGRVDLLAGLGTGVAAYYDALGGIELGAEDVDRRAAALDIVAEAQMSKGDLDGALVTWKRAQADLDATIAASPDDPATAARRRRSADALVGQGRVHLARGSTDAAISAFTAGIAAYDRMLHDTPDDADLALGAARAHDQFGDLYRPRGHVDEALAQFRAALELREAVAARKPDDRDVQAQIARSHHEIGTVDIAAAHSADALAELAKSIAILKGLLAKDPDEPRWQAQLEQVLGELASFQRQLGELDEAIATYEAALPVVELLVRRDTLNTQYQRDRGNLLSDFGFARLDQGDYAGAIDDFTKSIANHEALLQLQQGDTRWVVDLSRTYGRRGDAYLAAGNVPAAIADYTKARDQREALLAKDPTNPVWRRTAAWGYHKLATGLAVRGGKGDVDEAIALQRKALDLRTELVKQIVHQSQVQDELSQSQVVLGDLLATHGSLDEGLALLDAGIDASQALVDADPLDAAWKQTLVRGLVARGEAYRKRGDHVRATADLERAVVAAGSAAAKAPRNAEWQTELAVAHWGLARCLRDDSALDSRLRAAAEATTARDLLDQLQKSGRLSAEFTALSAEVRGGLRDQ
jgi:tetratricopeptide (TPR) repeat protein